MYSRLLLESLRRGTRRKLLALSAVAVGTLGTTALASVLLASGDRLALEMGSYGANLEVTAPPGRPLPASALSVVRRIFWRNNVVAVAPWRSVRVRFESAGLVAPLAGTWFDHPLDESLSTGLPRTRPTLRLAGRWPREGEAELALGRRLARRLGLIPGDRATARLGGRSELFTVTGIVTSGGEEEEEEGFTGLARLARLTGEGEVFERAEVFALTTPEPAGRPVDPRRLSPEQYESWYCTAYPSSISHQLQEALPAARVRVVPGITRATAEVLGRLRGALLALMAVTLCGAAVGVTSTMTATFLERRLEAGLLVAIGAYRGHVAGFFLVEAALLGALGGGLGGALGLPAGRWLGSYVLGVEVPWIAELVPLAASAGLLLAVLSSFAPVSRALEKFPAEILKRAAA